MFFKGGTNIKRGKVLMKFVISCNSVVLILVLLLCSSAGQKDCQTEGKLKITPLSLRVDYREVSDSSISVMSPVAWSAETNAQWIKIDRNKGEGPCRVTIVVKANIEAEGRSASLIFKSPGEKPVTVVIFQKALHEE